MLRDYLELATSIAATNVRDIVSYLDQGKCEDVCAWLEGVGGADLVAGYRTIVPTPPSPPGAIVPS